MDSTSSENMWANNSPAINPSGHDSENQIPDLIGSNPNVSAQIEKPSIGTDATSQHTVVGSGIPASTGAPPTFSSRVWIRPPGTSEPPPNRYEQRHAELQSNDPNRRSGRSSYDLAEIRRMLSSLVEKTQSQEASAQTLSARLVHQEMSRSAIYGAPLYRTFGGEVTPQRHNPANPSGLLGSLCHSNKCG